MRFITVQFAPVEIPTSRKTARGKRISYRWGSGYAIRQSDDQKNWTDLVQPYESGRGAKARAVRYAKEEAKANNAEFIPS